MASSHLSQSQLTTKIQLEHALTEMRGWICLEVIQPAYRRPLLTLQRQAGQRSNQRTMHWEFDRSTQWSFRERKGRQAGMGASQKQHTAAISASRSPLARVKRCCRRTSARPHVNGKRKVVPFGGGTALCQEQCALSQHHRPHHHLH